MKSLNLFWLLLVLVFSSPKILATPPNQSALLAIAQQLHCADSKRDSQVLLSQLMSLSTEPFGIPSDNFDGKDNHFLYAATVDILLQQLLETGQRYPSLQESIERTALLWNFCEVIKEGKLVDLSMDYAQHAISQLALTPFPAKRQGFSRWGFLNPDPNDRYIPKLLDLSLFPLAQQSLLFRVFVKQCFPHPDTGKLFTELNESKRVGKLRLTPDFKLGKRYPYQWKTNCNPEPIQTIIEIPPPSKPIKKIAKVFKAKPIKVEVIAPIEKVTIVKATIKPKPKRMQKQKPTPKPKGVELEPITIKKEPLFAPNTIPADGETPTFYVATAGAGSNSGAVLPLPKKDGYGFTGNFYHNSPLAGTLAVGGMVSWNPHSYFFIRGGGHYKYHPGKGVFSYSWGIGYDDWHPGTFSFQLNNWGPILPEEGFAFDKAIADIGYKFKANFLEDSNVSGSASFVIPVTGDQQISTTWSWAPFEYWFIRVGFQAKPFAYDGVTWTYGFGYSDWHPFTVGIAYNNWGLNSLTDSKGDGINFKENGLVTLSWSWAF